MTFKTFSNNWVVFKSALKRLKWLSILYGIVLFLDLPLTTWMKLNYQKTQDLLWLENIKNMHLSQMFLHPITMIINITVPIIFGLLLFQYLQNEKASTFFHSLPIKRNSLYRQNIFAGLTMIWLPILINGILFLSVFSSFGITEGKLPNMTAANQIMNINNGPITVPIGTIFVNWMILNLLMTGFFFIFTVFVGMLTGNVLLQGALTYIGLVLPLGIYVLIKYNFWKLLLGYPREIDEKVVDWLSPLASYLSHSEYLLSNGMKYYVAYFMAALIISAISVFLYKQRHVEAAGETLAAGWIRQVFKYGVATCTALALGLYFSEFVGESTGVLYVGYFTGAVLGYIIADMIAYKSFRFYERWKGMVVFGAIFIFVLVSVKFDFFGYERYVPEQKEVKEVAVSIINNDRNQPQALSQKENIEKVLQLHRQIINNEKYRSSQQDPQKRQDAKSINGVIYPLNTVRSVDITYLLDNGEKVKRSYTIDISRYRKFLYPIATSQEAKKIIYGQLFKMDSNNLEKIEINNFHLNKSVRIYNRKEIEEALTALQKDILNISYEAAIEGKVPSRASIEFISKTNEAKEFSSYNIPYYIEYKNFDSFLEEHGYLKDLILKPDNVSKIIVKEAGTDKTVEVKDKKQIEILLNRCSAADEKSYLSTPNQTEKIYFGKVEIKNDNLKYIVFDNDPVAQQEIQKLFK